MHGLVAFRITHEHENYRYQQGWRFSDSTIATIKVKGHERKYQSVEQIYTVFGIFSNTQAKRSGILKRRSQLARLEALEFALQQNVHIHSNRPKPTHQLSKFPSRISKEEEHILRRVNRRTLTVPVNWYKSALPHINHSS